MELERKRRQQSCQATPPRQARFEDDLGFLGHPTYTGNRGMKKADRKHETSCWIKGGCTEMNELPATRPLFTTVPGSELPLVLTAAPFSIQQEKPPCAYVKGEDMTGRLYFI